MREDDADACVRFWALLGTEHWGSPRAFLRDPAGHRVEVMAFPPGAATA